MAAVVILAFAGVAAYLILRPSYAVREFRQGLAYYAAGKDDLALQSLNASLAADPRSSDALLARARVHVRKGQFQPAFADYDTADQIDPSPLAEVGAGYCLNKLGQSQQAAAAYTRALKGGYESPAVLNNLGYCSLRLGRLDDAEKYLLDALQADHDLQAAHHNLVVLYSKRALDGKAVPVKALDHARRALEIGPESGELCRDVALLYALAADQDASLTQKAIEQVARAVSHGISPSAFTSNPAFSAIKAKPGFTEAVARKGAQPPIDAVHVIEPTGERR
jgi:tetratricopeptide (TPR) repeat protein